MPIPVNLNEYEALARERLSPMVYDYFAGGANDEVTLTDNMRSWQRLRLHPRVLVDVSHIDTTTTVLGHTLTMPVITAPCSFNALAHPEGECAVARATSAAGILQIVSMTASKSIEEIAATGQGPRWFQLICFRDREITRDLVRRAEAAQCSALCLTIDQPLQGRRERDVRNRFHLPPGVTMKNLEPYAADKLSADDNSPLAKFVDEMFDASSYMGGGLLVAIHYSPADPRQRNTHCRGGQTSPSNMELPGLSFQITADGSSTALSVLARRCRQLLMPSAGGRKCW